MNRKKQKRKQLQGNPGGRCIGRRVLAWMLCVVMAFGGIWVPGTEMSVQAEGAEDVSVQAAEESFGTWDAEDVSEDGVPGNAVTAVSLSGAEDDIASGTYENITWRIDVNGKLTVEGTGEYSASKDYDRAPWYSESEKVKSAEIHISGLRDASCMFWGCNSLTSLDLSKLDTSSVTNINGMFAGCSDLPSLDLSSFDTSNVTDMSYMFAGCSSLPSLDLSKLNTSSVTDMSYMFAECSGLTSLDVSRFDTSNVTDMSYMFGDEWGGCSGLTSLNVSSFDTSGVQNMTGMFAHCSSLTSLEVSRFDTSSVKFMNQMFYGCSGLTSLDMSGFDTSSVKFMDQMFKGCSSLTSLDMSKLNTSNVTDMSNMFSGCRALKIIHTIPNLQHTVDLPVSMQDASGKIYEQLPIELSESIELMSFSDAEYDIASGTYEKITWRIDANGKLTVEGTGEFSASKNDDRAPWYSEREKVKSAEIHISGLRDASYMFFGCDRLTSLDMSKLDTSSVTDMSRMFFGCSSLTSLDLRSFDTSSVTDMSRMFYGCSSLTSLDVSRFDTSSVTDMSYMFAECSGLTSLDVSRFDTSSVTDMRYMFLRCRSLTSLDVSGFDTSNVTDISGMFLACSNLTSLDLSSFDTSSVTDMNQMFRGCSGLTSLDVSGFDTSSVKEMFQMFMDCSSLRSMDLSSFDTSSVKYMNEMFEGCSGLTSLDVSGFDTSSVEEMPLMFDGCRGLTILDVSGFDTSNVKFMDAMFSGCRGLTSLDLSGFDMSSMTRSEDMLWRCDGLTTLYAPYNVDLSLALPGSEKTDVWYDAAGNTYTSLPEGLDHSIILMKNGKPDAGIFRVSIIPAQNYSGSAIKPVVRVYCGSRRLTEKTDYTITYKNNIKANDAKAEKTAPTITVTGKGDYSGKQTVTFAIQPKSIKDEDVTIAELFAAQSGKVQKPVPVMTWKGRKLKVGTDFTVNYPDENKPGAYQTAAAYKVIVTGIGNYTGTRILNFTITDKPLLSKAKVTVKAKDYTGGEVTLNAEDITVKMGKDTLVYGKDYTLSYRDNTQAGKATVIVTGTGDTYAGSKEATFQIKGESLAKAQITGIVDKTYTGAAQTQNIQVHLNGKILKIGEDYKVSYAKSVDVGTATVTVTGKGNYTGSVKKSFKITAYDLQANEAGSLKGVPQNLITAYTKSGATPSLTLTFGGKPLVAKKDYTVTYKNNKKLASAYNAKAPVMVIKGKGNFKGTLTVPFTITLSNLRTKGNVTITASDTAYVAKAGKYMTKPVLTDANGKKLTAGTDYEKTFTYTLVGDDGTEIALTAADIVPEGGKVKVTVTGKGNYTGTLSATYRITKASFAKAKITVTPQAYTGGAVTLSAKDIKVELGGKTLTYGTDYTIVPGSYRNNTKKGTATVTVIGQGNYGGMKTVKFRITAKPLAAFKLFP